MNTRQVVRRARALVVALGVLGFGALTFGTGCRVPREVHRALPYPEARVNAKRLLVKLAHAGQVFLSPTGKELSLPADFLVKAESRLWQVAGERGPDLEVVVSVVDLQEIEIVDARGEVSRLSVELEITVRELGGKSLLRGSTRSNADIPRLEATQDELQWLVASTALNAFDRFWASESTVVRINRALTALSSNPG